MSVIEGHWFSLNNKDEMRPTIKAMNTSTSKQQISKIGKGYGKKWSKMCRLVKNGSFFFFHVKNPVQNGTGCEKKKKKKKTAI